MEKEWLEKDIYLFEENCHVQNDLLHPFAVTDALILRSGRESIQQIHFWQTTPSMIMGMMDTRLNHFSEAIQYIKESPYQLVIRNSGGLGIISDAETLNMTLFFPQNHERITIDEGYERMVTLIQQMITELNSKLAVEVGEVEGSYCPGHFDLSINGKKFAGIAQRRLKNGLAVMIYLSVSGDQDQRSKWMKAFYQKGLQNEQSQWQYPKVQPQMMTTLAAALNIPKLQPKRVKELLLRPLSVKNIENDTLFKEDYQKAYQKMKKRNQQFLMIN